MKESLVEPVARRLENACNHLDTLAPQSADAAARHLRIRIDATDDNFLDAGVENRVGTRRRPAFVATRLEVHIEGGLAPRVVMTTPSRKIGRASCRERV